MIGDSTHYFGLVAIFVASLFSTAANGAGCVTIDSPNVIKKLNEAIRSEVEHYSETDAARYTLERALSFSKTTYSDCVSYYTVELVPFSPDPDLFAIGTTYLYTVSRRTMTVVRADEY